MGKPGPVMIASGGKENLGLVLQSPERLAMKNLVTVVLEGRAEFTGLFFLRPAPGPGAERRMGRKSFLFIVLEHFTNPRVCCDGSHATLAVPIVVQRDHYKWRAMLCHGHYIIGRDGARPSTL